MPPAADDVAFPILGRPLRARGVLEPLRAWLDEHWSRPGHAPPPHPFAITLDCADPGRVPAALEGEAVRATGPGVAMVWCNAGPTWEWRSGGGAGVRLTLEPERARILAWGTASPDADHFAALYLALCEALRASGLVPLHAAVAVPPGGAGGVGGRTARPAGERSTTFDPAAARPNGAIAFLGPSGTGKSTTLLRLTRAGWTPLAEDLSWIEPDTLTLYGWDRGVRLWPGTLEAFLPELAGAAWTPGPDGKLFLGYDELGRHGPGGGDIGRRDPGRRDTDDCDDAGHHGDVDDNDLGDTDSRRATLTAIALLERATPGESGWQPLPLRDAVRALWEAVGVPLGPAARQAAAAWIGAAPGRLGSHRLRLGTTQFPAPPPAG